MAFKIGDKIRIKKEYMDIINNFQSLENSALDEIREFLIENDNENLFYVIEGSTLFKNIFSSYDSTLILGRKDRKKIQALPIITHPYYYGFFELYDNQLEFEF